MILLTVVSITRFSQHLDASPFLNLTIHFPPCLLASSYNKQVNSRHNNVYVYVYISEKWTSQ